MNIVEADYDKDGYAVEYDTLAATPAGRREISLQEAYVRTVIETINGPDGLYPAGATISKSRVGLLRAWKVNARAARSHDSRSTLNRPWNRRRSRAAIHLFTAADFFPSTGGVRIFIVAPGQFRFGGQEPRGQCNNVR
jgi:hypothetical protein